MPFSPRHSVSALLIAVLLSACASGPERATIADLELPPVRTINPAVDFNVSREQVIERYRKLVEITPQDAEFGQEYKRLADLELESSMDEQVADDPLLVAAGKVKAKLAVDRYQRYLERFPNRPDNDKVLYQLSRAFAVAGEEQRARAALDSIAEDFPESQYIDEVQFRRGESLFVEGDYAAAERAYAVIVNDHPQSIYYEKSLYKHGWALFKQNRLDEARKSYVTLLDVNLKQGKLGAIALAPNLSRGDNELLEDVLRVLSLTFSYSDDKQPVAKFFNREGQREYEPLIYQRLSELYLSKERITDAVDNNLAFTERYPFSIYTPDFHGNAIDALKSAGFTELVLQEKQNFIRQYNKGSTYWNQADAGTRTRLQPVLTGHIADTATHYHAVARSSKKPGDYRNAADWYQRYLVSFPEDGKAAQMNFLLGETRFEAGQYQLAIREYEKTAYDYPRHDNAAEAGYAALLSYRMLLKTSKVETRPPIEQRLIASSLRFSDRFPADKRVPTVLLSTSEKLYDLKDYNRARTTATRLTQDPKLEPATRHKAWIIVAHSAFESGDLSSAEQAYQQVLRGLQPKQRKEREEFREQLASSIYLQGEQARKLGDHRSAAQHFLRVGKLTPTSPKRVVAHYDAATAYIQLKDWPQAIALLEGFRKAYPKETRWRQGISEKLALAYSESKQSGKAAGELMTLVAMAPAAEKRDMMWQAAQLYEQDGQQSKAIDIYKDYIKRYPDPLARSIELRHKIALSYLAKKDSKNYHYWLKEIVKADANGKAQRSDRSRYLAATASLELVKPQHQAFSNARLTIPLKKSLGKKKKLMSDSIKAYTKAAKYQVEEVTTAATFNIAEIYREFARALLDSDRPKGLNEEELEEYTYLLEDQAFPFEEKAISIHETNLARIPAGSYDDSIQASIDSLARLLPFRYGKTEMSDAYAE